MGEPYILHVEDDDAAALLVRLALEEAGPDVHVHRVADVDTAIDFLLKTQSPELPNLVLLDLNLPRKNGFDMLEALRASNSLANLRVVVLTSSEAPIDRKTAAAWGVNAYLVKPSSFEGYIDILQKVVTIAGS